MTTTARVRPYIETMHLLCQTTQPKHMNTNTCVASVHEQAKSCAPYTPLDINAHTARMIVGLVKEELRLGRDGHRLTLCHN